MTANSSRSPTKITRRPCTRPRRTADASAPFMRLREANSSGSATRVKQMIEPRENSMPIRNRNANSASRSAVKNSCQTMLDVFRRIEKISEIR